MPFGEVGNTNLGKFTIEAGSFTLPRDPSIVTLNSEHDRETPIGRATALEERPDGIYATFTYADTDEADAALLEYQEGTRSALSVEAKGIVLRAGKALAGYIFGAAQVAKGAFPSAMLLAADVGTLPVEPLQTVLDAEPVIEAPLDPAHLILSVDELPDDITATTSTGDTATYTTTERPTPESEPVMATAVIHTSETIKATPRPVTLSIMAGLLYAANQGTLSDEGRRLLADSNGATLFGALSDVKFDGVGGVAVGGMMQPQYIGEVWSAVTYTQQVLPLFDHRDLTSLTINGFSWTTKPAGGTWAGNKADVPSNTVVAAPVTATAERYAIGHDIAREFVDFNVPGFFESYAAAVAEDYARWVDGRVAVKALAGATALTADALTTLPGASGGTIGSAASAIIDGATALVTMGTLPTFALVAPALWKQMAKQPRANVLGYLNAALGLSEGDLDGFIIRPSASITAGKVLVGAKQAVSVYELPGVPIRIDALDLAKGGVDKAAFGYAGVVINDARGLQLVTAATV